MYDVAIIGAGLSGLSAAYHLDGLNICIVEKEEYVGGRVLTKKKNGIVYELGALFGYDKTLVPFEFAGSSLIQENDRIGLLHENGLFWGDSVFNCIRNCVVDENAWTNIIRFYTEDADASSLSDAESKIVNSFFRVIHPGDFRGYIGCRQRDAFTRFRTDHYTHGNGELVDEYLKRVSADIHLGSTVHSVIEKESFVEVSYAVDRNFRSLAAKAVIVTVPAPLAAGMVQMKNARCAQFLDSVRYGAGMIAVIALRNVDILNFAYLVATDNLINTVVKIKTAMNDVTLLNAYVVGDRAEKLAHVQDHEIISSIVESVNRCSLGCISENDIIFSDVRMWPRVGPIISGASYARWDDDMRRPSERVLLAGDYVFMDGADPMPYGMTAAILSGRHAAEDCIHQLRVVR